MKYRKIKAIISGGGTGGHIFPAISIADALKKINPQNEVLFVGAKGKMEMEKVPAAGYEIIGLKIAGLQRKLTLKNIINDIKVPLLVVKSVLDARKIIKKFNPDIVIGVGGFASGPLLWAAQSMKIPTLLQEQNGFAGLTNKLLAKKAGRICVAYEGMERFFPKERIVLTGNPIRPEIVSASFLPKAEGESYFELDPDKPESRLQSLNNTVIITEQMAQSVMELTPAVLRGTLSKYDFSPEAIEASVKRLNAVKERVENGKKLGELIEDTRVRKVFLRDPIKVIKERNFTNAIITLPSKHLEALNIDSFGQHTSFSDPVNPRLRFNCGVCDNISVAHRRDVILGMIRNNEKNGIKPTTSSTQAAVPIFQDVHGMSRSLNAVLSPHIRKLSELRRVFPDEAASSAQLMGTMKKLNALTDRLKQDNVSPSDSDLNRFSELSTQLRKDCMDYLTVHAPGSNPAMADTQREMFIDEVMKLGQDTKDIGNEMQSIRDQELMELNMRMSHQAKVIRQMAIEHSAAQSALTMLTEKSPIDREALKATAAKVIYMDALHCNVNNVDPDTLELMMNPDIIKANMNKLLPRVSEYFENIDQKEEHLSAMLKDKDCSKILMSGFVQYVMMTKPPHKAAPEKENDPEKAAGNDQTKAKEQKAEQALRSFGLS